jgi:hypothetical protein
VCSDRSSTPAGTIRFLNLTVEDSISKLYLIFKTKFLKVHKLFVTSLSFNFITQVLLKLLEIKLEYF